MLSGAFFEALSPAHNSVGLGKGEISVLLKRVYNFLEGLLGGIWHPAQGAVGYRGKHFFHFDWMDYGIWLYWSCILVGQDSVLTLL